MKRWQCQVTDLDVEAIDTAVELLEKLAPTASYASGERDQAIRISTRLSILRASLLMWHDEAQAEVAQLAEAEEAFRP